MIAVATQRALDPKLILDLLGEHEGQYPFAELVHALQAKGLDESESRELIWQVLALGFIEFTADRSFLRLRQDSQYEGKVA
jgi:hypothetical protein